MSLRTFLKPLSFLPALVLMYLIYSFSAQEGETSAALSYKVSYYTVKTADQVLDTDLQEWEIESFANRFHVVTRKLAHMTEYFALAVAVSFPLYVYGLHGIPLMLIAGMICVAYACGDEYHQSFVAGRSPSKKDVLIDSFGVFWGIILVRIVGWTGRKTIFRPLRRKKREDTFDDYPEDAYFYDTGFRDPQDDFPPYARPSFEPDYEDERVSSYYNTAQRQSRRRNTSYEEYPFPPQPYDQEPEEPDQPRGSDKLSEDLSLKKLVRDIREQHHQTHQPIE